MPEPSDDDGIVGGLRAMPPMHRAALRCALVEGLRTDDIAARLEVSKSEATKLLAEAMQYLVGRTRPESSEGDSG